MRLALIGPPDSIRLIREVAVEFGEGFKLVEKPYRSFEELKDVNGFCKEHAVDVVLFSGQVPYHWVKQQENLDCPALYIPRDGTCLYRSLFDVYRDGVDISALSFDTVKKETIIETYQDLRLPMGEVYTFEYEGYINYEEVTRYHLELWSSGKTVAAVTGLNTPYWQLKEKGVPVYRMFPTRSIVRESLRKALLYGESVRLKHTQLALVLVRPGLKEDGLANLGYTAQQLVLDLHRTLVEYAQQIQGLVVKLRDTEFAIVATRGSLEEVTNCFREFPLLDSIERNLPMKVGIGIGLGRTALSAEANAREGLRLALTVGRHSACFVVTDDGKVLEPIYSRGNYPGEDLVSLSSSVGLRPTTLSKIKRALQRLDREHITSQELASAMGISERSARRVLSRLEEKGLAEVLGGNPVRDKGRPRLVYRLMLE
ncbi:MAG: HTH domain-containing protein [Bacillota bacterium]